MRDYLLDTNAISLAITGNAAVEARLKSVASAHLFVSAVALAEIEYGSRVQSPYDEEQHQARMKFIRKHGFRVLDVSESTAEPYGTLRAELFETYLPRKEKNGSRRKGLTGRRPEQLLDPTSSQALGIQENDLWMAAQAIERNLVLVSGDRMERIRKVAGTKLVIVNWADPLS